MFLKERPEALNERDNRRLNSYGVSIKDELGPKRDNPGLKRDKLYPKI